MSEEVSVRDARARLASLLAQAEEGEPTVITRAGEPVAAVVPMEAFQALEEAADELLAREARQALADEAGEPLATMPEVLADILGETGRTDAA